MNRDQGSVLWIWGSTHVFRLERRVDLWREEQLLRREMEAASDL